MVRRAVTGITGWGYRVSRKAFNRGGRGRCGEKLLTAKGAKKRRKERKERRVASTGYRVANPGPRCKRKAFHCEERKGKGRVASGEYRVASSGWVSGEKSFDRGGRGRCGEELLTAKDAK